LHNNVSNVLVNSWKLGLVMEEAKVHRKNEWSTERGVRVIVFNANFNNISVILWRSVL